MFNPLKWISKLWKRDKRCVKTLARDDIAMAVWKLRNACGHHAYSVELQVYRSDTASWQPLVLLDGEDVHNVLWLLTEAAKYMDGVRHNDYELAAVH